MAQPGGSEKVLRQELAQIRANLKDAQEEIARLRRGRESHAATSANPRHPTKTGHERAVALDEANAALAQVNAELNLRVEQEVKAREATQAELFQMQKLEAIGQLTGGIAHDFNNLLTIIISGMQLLGQLDDPARRARVIRRTEEAAWRGADLTRRLLTFARRQTLHPARLELSRHMDSLRELLTRGLREDIQVRTKLESGLWPVEADIGALELALLNLAVNARDAMPGGGLIVLAAANASMSGPQAARLDLTPGDYVRITVNDNGAGMPADMLDRAFEPFFTTKTGEKGTGLGLAQVYGFAKQSGGTAWVESQAGQGTSVHIALPRSLQEAPAEDADTPPPAPRAPRRGERLSVLVVEDDDEVAATVLDMLGQLGHSGTRVATVASALAILSGVEELDLVFSDVLLPGGGSGLDLAREMTRRQIGTPMILTSGYGGGMLARLAAADLPFLRKPYRLDALRQAIDQALHSRTAAAKQVAG